LTDAGKNPVTMTNLISSLTLTNLTKEEADAASGKITAVGGKIEIHITATGPDITRGWGMRQRSVRFFGFAARPLPCLNQCASVSIRG
jgi:hypothetical protein